MYKKYSYFYTLFHNYEPGYTKDIFNLITKNYCLMVSIEIQENAGNDWNKKLIESKFGTIFQTKEYGHFTQSILGWDTNFLRFVNTKGEIIGQLMLSVYSRFGKRGKIGKL